MRNYWKYSFIMFAVVFFTACKDDEESEVITTDLENAELAFNTSEPPIDIPSGLLNSSNAEAATISGYLQSANALTGWLTVFEAPANATKSTTPVNGKSGRNGRSEDDVVVYTWNFDDGGGNNYTYAYQVTDAGSKYQFEIFLAFNDGPLNRIIYAEESKDAARNGFMEIFVASLLSEEEVSDSFAFKFEWSENAIGVLDFRYTIGLDSSIIITDITVSPDGSGELSYVLGGVKIYEATWVSDGSSGTFARYDFDGNLIEAGVWP